MNNSKLFIRRSQTIDPDKQNRKKLANLQNNMIKASKRKPKLMSNNRIMQKLFPNFQTIDQERSLEHQRIQPITFRKLEGGDYEQKMFKELFDKQKQKYQAILNKHLIAERPQRHEIQQFLAKGKGNSALTYRL